jgi:hypothetical protein
MWSILNLKDWINTEICPKSYLKTISLRLTLLEKTINVIWKRLIYDLRYLKAIKSQ